MSFSVFLQAYPPVLVCYVQLLRELASRPALEKLIDALPPLTSLHY